MYDRKFYTTRDIVKDIWAQLDLPPAAISSLELPHAPGKPAVPSSFKIDKFAHGAIALSALAAATVYAHSARSKGSTRLTKGEEIEGEGEGEGKVQVPRVSVHRRHALLEFQCERFYTLAGKPPAKMLGGPLAGLHPTADGYVRIHDSFPHHRRGALALLGLLPQTDIDTDMNVEVDRAAVDESTRKWKSVELETVAVEQKGLAIYALRSFAEWDALPQGRAELDAPVRLTRYGGHWDKEVVLRKIKEASHRRRFGMSGIGGRKWKREGDRTGDGAGEKCLTGLRVLEFSRVIAAPVAGKTLAAHGADVLWATSPHLPDLPVLDREFSRGKRSISLDLDRLTDISLDLSDLTDISAHHGQGSARALELASTADVIVQGYRPGSLAERGIEPGKLACLNPGIIIANLSAFGSKGPWGRRRGFDSLVQTACGLNIAEAERAGLGEVARVLPCQALDHGAGYLLATGICAALYHRDKDRREGRLVGAYIVDVSLAGVGMYLRSLGQLEGQSGYERPDCTVFEDGEEEERAKYFETRDTEFGEMTFLRHSASVEGLEPGWDLMPTPLGSCEPVWADE
ncbi:CoA-transferase family III [Xylaria venustula]|nr:CoA-transferase family III [Xylaria venustula]